MFLFPLAKHVVHDFESMFVIPLVADCGPLSNPANGQVDISSGTTLNSVATYSCYTGYNVTGESTRICTADGQWTPTAPTCVGELCLVIVLMYIQV